MTPSLSKLTDLYNALEICPFHRQKHDFRRQRWAHSSTWLPWWQHGLQTSTWILAAAQSWTSPWPSVATQTMDINQTPAAVGPRHSSLQQYSPRHHHSLRWQFRSLKSVWYLEAEWPMDNNVEWRCKYWPRTYSWPLLEACTKDIIQAPINRQLGIM